MNARNMRLEARPPRGTDAGSSELSEHYQAGKVIGNVSSRKKDEPRANSNPRSVPNAAILTEPKRDPAEQMDATRVGQFAREHKALAARPDVRDQPDSDAARREEAKALEQLLHQLGLECAEYCEAY